MVNELYSLRRQAFPGIALPGIKGYGDQSLAAAARHFQRHNRTVGRWEKLPENKIDPVIREAYSYLAGHLLGWPGFRVKSKDELILPDGSTLHRNLIMNYHELIKILRDQIAMLEGELQQARDLLPRKVLVSWLKNINASSFF